MLSYVISVRVTFVLFVSCCPCILNTHVAIMTDVKRDTTLQELPTRDWPQWSADCERAAKNRPALLPGGRRFSSMYVKSINHH